MLIQELKQVLQDLICKFLKTHFSKDFKNIQLKVIHHSQDTNHDIHLNSLFQSLYKLFSHACNLHLQYLLDLNCYKNLLFQAMLFH